MAERERESARKDIIPSPHSLSFLHHHHPTLSSSSSSFLLSDWRGRLHRLSVLLLLVHLSVCPVLSLFLLFSPSPLLCSFFSFLPSVRPSSLKVISLPLKLRLVSTTINPLALLLFLVFYVGGVYISAYPLSLSACFFLLPCVRVKKKGIFPAEIKMSRKRASSL